MIVETAHIMISPGRESEFLEALAEGRKVLERAEGFKSLVARRGIERPNVVMLQLEWATLENHTIDFRQGPLFAQWRAVISPFFAQDSSPQVEHWEPTDA